MYCFRSGNKDDEGKVKAPKKASGKTLVLVIALVLFVSAVAGTITAREIRKQKTDMNTFEMLENVNFEGDSDDADSK